MMLYCFQKLHFSLHGVTFVKPFSRQYYTGLTDTFLRLQEFAQMMDFVSFIFLLIH